MQRHSPQKQVSEIESNIIKREKFLIQVDWTEQCAIQPKKKSFGNKNTESLTHS